MGIGFFLVARVLLQCGVGLVQRGLRLFKLAAQFLQFRLQHHAVQIVLIFLLRRLRHFIGYAALQQRRFFGQGLFPAVSSCQADGLAVIAAPNAQIGGAGGDGQRLSRLIGQLQRGGGVPLGPADGLPAAAVQVQAGAAAQVILPGDVVILDAAGGIQHQHVGEIQSAFTVGVLQRGAAAVLPDIHIPLAVIAQHGDAVRRPSNGQLHGAAHVLCGRLTVAKAERRGIVPLRGLTVGVQSGLHQLGGGVPAILRPDSGGVTVGVQRVGQLAQMQAVQVLVAEHVQQIAGVDRLVNVRRHRIQRQSKLQCQILRLAHRANFADIGQPGKHRHAGGSIALTDPFHKQARP